MPKHRVTLSDLDERQRRIAADKRLSERMNVRDLLGLLAPLARFDTAMARLRGQTRNAAVFAGIATFVTLFILVATQFPLWLVPVPITSMVLAIVTLRRYQRLTAMTLANKLPRVVVPLLAVLAEETADGAPTTLELDLRPADVAEKLVRDETLPPQGSWGRILLRVYQDPWMRGQADLRDGTRIEWRIVDEVRRLERRKNYGKQKTKIKVRNRSTLTVTLTLSKGKRAAVATGASAGLPAGTNVHVTTGEKRDRIEVSRVVKVGSIDSPEAAHLLDVMAVAFARARGSGNAGAGAGGKAVGA